VKGLWNRFQPKNPEQAPLGTDDILKRQRAGDQHRGDEGHPPPDLVGDDLRRRPAWPPRSAHLLLEDHPASRTPTTTREVTAIT